MRGPEVDAAFPPLDRSDCAPRLRAEAARVWQSLRDQEDRSRASAERLAADLHRARAPQEVLRLAEKVAADEGRHVALCETMLISLGRDPVRRSPALETQRETAAEARRGMVELIVAGFAVQETMSVGGFAAALRTTHDSLARSTLRQITRDEVGHGVFGEVAGAWILRGWSPESRRQLWPSCVAAMESIERRTGGPVGAQVIGKEDPALTALGAAPAHVVGLGMLRAIPRWVLPRLARLGVLPGA